VAPLRRLLALCGALALAATPLLAQDPPRGQIVDDVKCASDASQSYALYLPSMYSRDRPWSLLIAFHPAARGRAMVEKYRAAAEQYGYIVAGSNNSRNGSWQVSMASVQAMVADLGARFSIDPDRFYLTGMSGGARVAMQVALATGKIAGVIASSAGYPDSQPRKTVPFAVFGTAGTEDFNYIEMRQLDRALTSPHRLVVFEGGHTLPPDAVALEAIEWLELQAMKSGRTKKDAAVIDRLFAKREATVAAGADPAAAVQGLTALVDDFDGLRDVATARARATELSKQKDVRNALSRERAGDDAEVRLLDDILRLERDLRDDAKRMDSLAELRHELARLSERANRTADSPERRQARRVLRSIVAGAGERVQDGDYLRILQQYRLPGGGRGGPGER